MRHIVTDTFEDPARIFARKFLAMRRSIRGPTVKIAGNGDCAHGDNGPSKKFLFQVVVLQLALRQAQPPAVIDCCVPPRASPLKCGIAKSQWTIEPALSS